MTGSPLEARQNIFVYIFIAVVIVAVIVLAFLGILAAARRSRKQTLEWVNRQSKKRTKYINCINLGRIAKLENRQVALLWSICKRFHARNIEFLYRDNEAINDLFRNEYERLKGIPKTEGRIAQVFDLRYKLEQAWNQRLAITSTRSLKNGQEVIFFDSNRMPHSLVVETKTNDILALKIPEELKNSDLKPVPLSKFYINFKTAQGPTYMAEVRVIRYEMFHETDTLLITNHSATVQMLQRRNAKRIDIESICEFSAIKAVEKKHHLDMEIMDKRYKGLITDISATGCRIICQFPIKKNQYLNTYISLPGIPSGEVAGIIVDTRHSKDGESYVLHIKFFNVPQELSNNIYALTYGFIEFNTDQEIIS